MATRTVRKKPSELDQLRALERLFGSADAGADHAHLREPLLDAGDGSQGVEQRRESVHVLEGHQRQRIPAFPRPGAMRRERVEHRSTVAAADHQDLRVERDAGDAQLSSGGLLDQRSGPGLERASGVDRDPAVPGELHRLRVEHLRAGQGQLLHLLVRELGEPPGVGDDARIGAEHAVHVRADLADLRLQRGRQGDCRGVAASAAQGGDLLLPGDALVAGHDHHPAPLQRFQDADRPDLHDAGIGVGAIGDDPALGAGEADCVHPARVQRHAQKGHGDALAGGEEHVQLAPVRVGSHLAGKRQQLVGSVAHGGDHHHHLVAALARLRHPLRHPADLLDVGDRGAAVLLDQDRHRLQSTLSRRLNA